MTEQQTPSAAEALLELQRDVHAYMEGSYLAGGPLAIDRDDFDTYIEDAIAEYARLQRGGAA